VPCAICQHADRAAIEQAVSRGDSYRLVAGRYGIDKSTLSRHVHRCLTPVSTTPQAVTTAPAHLVNADLHHQALALADEAMKCYDAGGLRHVVRSLGELVAQIVKDAGESAPQADHTARQWNRL
jgi:hypothetical protein